MKRLGVLLLLGLGPVACDEPGPQAPADAVMVDAVVPAPGATGVDPSTLVTVRFSQPIAAGTDAWFDVHRQGIAGPVVAGHWIWSADLRTATFHPDHPLGPGEMHAIHLGAGIRSASGAALNFTHCVEAGGQWAFGQPGWHHGEGGPHGDRGWMHSNGSYGVMFGFTTG